MPNTASELSSKCRGLSKMAVRQNWGDRNRVSGAELVVEIHGMGPLNSLALGFPASDPYNLLTSFARPPRVRGNLFMWIVYQRLNQFVVSWF